MERVETLGLADAYRNFRRGILAVEILEDCGLAATAFSVEYQMVALTNAFI